MSEYYLSLEVRIYVKAESEDEARGKAALFVGGADNAAPQSVRLGGYDIVCCTEE